MKKIYSARDPFEAEYLKSFLSRAGIDATIHGSLLWGARGELPMGSDSSPSVWIDEKDFEVASRLILEWEQIQTSTGESTWICASCGESNERHFLECWKCGASGENQPTVANTELSSEECHSEKEPENPRDLVTSPTIKSESSPFITAAVALLTIAALTSLFFIDRPMLLDFLDDLSFLVAEDIWSGKYWALLPPSFLHLSYWMFAFSLSWFWFLGGKIEKRYGHVVIAAIIGLSAFTTQSTSLLIHGTAVPGLIGVVCTLLGFVWAAGDLKHENGRPEFVSGFFIISAFFLLFPAKVPTVYIFNASYLVSFISGLSLAHIISKKSWRGPAIAWMAIVLTATLMSLFWMPWSVRWLTYKSHEHFLKDDIDRAGSFADSAVEIDPMNFEAHFARGAARISSFDLEIALSSFKTAASLDPGLADLAHLQQGVVFNLLHQYERAVEILGLAIKQNKSNSLAYAERGWSHYNLSDFDAARQDFTKAIELDPDNKDAYLGRGASAKETYSLPSAIEDLNKAIELSSSADHGLRGGSYFYLHDFTKALEEYRLGFKDGVFYPNLFSSRAWVHLEMGDLEEAVDQFQAELKRNPRNDSALLGLGVSQYKAASLDLALISINQAIEVNPRFAMAYLHRGIISIKRGDAEAAKRDFDKVLGLNARDAQAYFYRAISFLALGDKTAAELDRKKAVELDNSLAGRSLTEP